MNAPEGSVRGAEVAGKRRLTYRGREEVARSITRRDATRRERAANSSAKYYQTLIINNKFRVCFLTSFRFYQKELKTNKITKKLSASNYTRYFNFLEMSCVRLSLSK